MPPRPSRICFDDVEFDPATGELWREGRRVRLQRQPSRLLELLLANRGELVGRDEIRAALWGDDIHVDFERSLNFCVAKLRSALRDDAAAPKYIETIPTRGYRFIAPIIEQRPAVFVPASTRRGLSRGLLVIVLAIIAGLVFLKVFLGFRAVPTVVVVPFKNETGTSDLDRVAKGVSDATVAQLATSNRLRVIGNASDLTFSFRPPDMKAMGESLRAQYLVLGQMKGDGRRLRIVAHLIRVSDQTHVWAETYDRDTLDLPQQAAVASAIAAAVAARAGKR